MLFVRNSDLPVIIPNCVSVPHFYTGTCKGPSGGGNN